MNTMLDLDSEVLAALDFDIEELEDLNAPGFWRGFRDGVVGTGVVVGLVAGGIAIT